MPNYQDFVTAPGTPAYPTAPVRTDTHNIQILNDGTALAAGDLVDLNGWFGVSRRAIAADTKGTIYMQGGKSEVYEIPLPSTWNASLAAGAFGFWNTANGEWVTADPSNGSPGVRAVPRPDCRVDYADAAAAAAATDVTVHVALVSIGDGVA